MIIPEIPQAYDAAAIAFLAAYGYEARPVEYWTDHVNGAPVANEMLSFVEVQSPHAGWSIGVEFGEIGAITVTRSVEGKAYYHSDYSNLRDTVMVLEKLLASNTNKWWYL